MRNQMVKLQKMGLEMANAFYEETISDFAEANVITGKWSIDESLIRSKEHFTKQMPNGVNTKEHLLFSIFNEKKKHVGNIWTTSSPENKLWIQNIKIFPRFQRNGYGRAAIIEIKKIAESIGVEKIGLHVFGYNKTAVQFYEAIDFNLKSMIFECDLQS